MVLIQEAQTGQRGSRKTYREFRVSVWNFLPLALLIGAVRTKVSHSIDLRFKGIEAALERVVFTEYGAHEERKFRWRDTLDTRPGKGRHAAPGRIGPEIRFMLVRRLSRSANIGWGTHVAL